MQHIRNTHVHTNKLKHCVFSCLLLNIPGTLIMWALTCLTGIVVFSHYFYVGCDPLRTDLIGSPTQVSQHTI